jgi:catechol 2,3-dioxygenase-like lactoylglutathione lyase family enzyme/nitrite reductase/ring-hydroxylating ferredoxin subunit
LALYEGFSHLVLPVSDLDRSEKFYQEVFGLELVGRNLVAEAQPNALLKSDCRQMVVLVQADAVKTEREGANSTHHAWLLRTPAEYQACIAKLKTMGFEVEDYRAAFRAAGQYSVDLVDPDGHRFQIQTLGPEATEIRMAKKGIVRCGPVESHAIGSVTLHKEEQFFLLRLEQGFLAISQWCTHQNGLVAWRGNFYDFYCDKHGAVFNRTGDPASAIMDLPPLRLHPLRIDAAGEVEVDTDRVVLRRGFTPDQLVPAEPGAALAVAKLKSAREVV